jgi:hypothetical protein
VTEMCHDCDRCGVPIERGRTLLRVECGPLRGRQDTIDLCSACTDALVSWLATPSSGHGVSEDNPPSIRRS